jgi:hypothetical protein
MIIILLILWRSVKKPGVRLGQRWAIGGLLPHYDTPHSRHGVRVIITNYIMLIWFQVYPH